MKSLFFAVALAMGNLLYAQESKPFLEISNSLENLPCSGDTMERTITLEQIQNNQPQNAGNFKSNGCRFSLDKPLPDGTYILTILVLGYEESKIKFEVSPTTAIPIVLNPVSLKEKMNTLSEVTVYGSKKEFLKVESDKTTISVKDNAMLNNGSSLEAVKKLPGVITSPTGSLTLNSKNVKIYIDGAPSSLSGTDLQNYLAGLPANAIEKVELIYNPGASFEANSSGSVINIITSTKRMKGVNASFNINYNFNKYQKPSPQILMNGKEKNLSWQTMLGYNYIDGETLNETQQVFASFTPAEMLKQRNFSKSTFRNLYFRTGTNYRLSDKSNVLFNYNGNWGNNRNVFDASTLGTDIDFQNNGVSKEKSINHELSLQYKTKLDTLGTTLDITAYSNFMDRNPLTQSSAFDDPDYSFNNGNIDFASKNYYLKYDFSFPFEKYKFSINTGGKYNVVKVTDYGKYNFNSPTNDIFHANDFASAINFDYTETNLAFYAEARKKIKKFNFTAGLRFEDYNVERTASTIDGELNFDNSRFFPNLSVLYEINENVNISSSYSKKISQPDYFTLDPNNNSAFDQYNTSQGNPFLNPVFFDNYEIKMTAFQFFQLGANYTMAKNRNQFVFSAEPGELVSNSTFQQFDKTKTFSVFASLPIPLDYFFKSKEEFAKRKNMMDKMNYIFLNANYVKTDIEDYAYTMPNKGTVNYSAQAQFILPWNITNTMSYFILPKGNWEIYKIEKPIQEFDISFNRDFMDKKLKIGLHCFDVFNANEVNAFIATPNLDTHFRQKPDTRTFRISLTYNFGNLKLENENTNINVDKSQQGGGLLK